MLIQLITNEFTMEYDEFQVFTIYLRKPITDQHLFEYSTTIATWLFYNAMYISKQIVGSL